MNKPAASNVFNSMTGFASAAGASGGYSWNWELRSVNGKGLDLRLRVPDWIDGLEAALRSALSGKIARGSVTLNLRVSRQEGASSLAINAAQLSSVLDALVQIEIEAHNRHIPIAPTKATDIAMMRGILDVTAAEENTAPLRDALLASLPELVEAYNTMRASEGAALRTLLNAQLSEMRDLTETATELAKARDAEMAETLKTNLAKVMLTADAADPDRVAQELAMIAVKSDITEEIDRLHTHVTSAKDLIEQGGPVGRKLDFLMQEFNREANTLCSKSQNSDLTRTGLALKALIDQMREQVQNVE